MRRALFPCLFVIALFAVPLLAACGDDDDDATPTSAASGPTTAANSSGASGELKVTAKDFSFDVPSDSIKAGAATNVTLTNAGQAPHTLTFYSDEDYKTKVADSGQVAAGQTASFSVTPPSGAKELYYRCEIHPTQMKGEIDVK